MIKVFTIGKTKEAFFKEAINGFLKRISRFTQVEYHELSKESLIKTVKDSYCVILLDVKGKSYSSEELASFIKKNELEKPLAFYVGDESGLPKEIIQKASFSLSFSRMTFPHDLARVMLLEQIYRALTINKNLPYHK